MTLGIFHIDWQHWFTLIYENSLNSLLKFRQSQGPQTPLGNFWNILFQTHSLDLCWFISVSGLCLHNTIFEEIYLNDGIRQRHWKCCESGHGGKCNFFETIHAHHKTFLLLMLKLYGITEMWPPEYQESKFVHFLQPSVHTNIYALAIIQV